MELHTHIKKLRQDRGLTQVQVAMRAQMSVRNYQRIEAGRCQPRIQTAKSIAEALNCTVEELFPVCEDAKTAAGDSSSSQNNCIKKKPLPRSGYGRVKTLERVQLFFICGKKD